MNKIINKILLAEDEFVPEIHLREPAALGEPGFTGSAHGWTEHKVEIILVYLINIALRNFLKKYP